jgi:hypothetical protein
VSVVKNIFLSVVVISALVVAGIGGTLADFSDSEEELGDSLQAGSLDLIVDGNDDPLVEAFSITGMVPCKQYAYTKTVHNMGTIDGYFYIHIKNAHCEETNIKDINGDGLIDELDKPEPERVAEQGGKVGQKWIVGIKERCDMEKHIDVWIYYDGVLVVDMVRLNQLNCQQIYIGELPACTDHDITFIFHLQDVDEDYVTIDNDSDGLTDEDPINGVDDDGDGRIDEDPSESYFDDSDHHEAKWDHWPTNCYMGDTVKFDVLYELLQTDYEPPS